MGEACSVCAAPPPSPRSSRRAPPGSPRLRLRPPINSPPRPATPPGLQWSAPSFLAWGRAARIGANATDPGAGPGYDDGTVALSVDAGSALRGRRPVDHDFEFVLKAPANGARRERRGDLGDGG